MKLSFGPDDERFRAELLAFLEEHAPPEAGKPYDVIDLAPDGEIIPEWLRAWQADRKSTRLNSSHSSVSRMPSSA